MGTSGAELHRAATIKERRKKEETTERKYNEEPRFFKKSGLLALPL